MKTVSPLIDPINFVNILLVGHSGVGKTYAVGGLKGLWYYTHEPDGVPVIRARNPTARIVVLEDGMADYGPMKAELTARHSGCSDGCEACRYTGLQAAADGCHAVAYDSLTEAQRICLNHAKKVNEKRASKTRADGSFTELDYNLSYQFLIRFLGMIREIRLPTFVLAHAVDPAPTVNLATGGTARYVRWYIPGKGFDSKVPRFFTAIGGIHHRYGPPEQRAVIFDPTVVWADRMFRAKSMAGLRSIEATEPQDWLDRISAATRGEETSTEPLEIEVSRAPAPSDPAFEPDPPPPPPIPSADFKNMIPQ